jgi:DUF971 family protein
MSWGNKLVIVFLAFGALMFYMVSRCIQTPVNLVSKEYYKDELAYQEVIDGQINANLLSSKVKIRQNADFVTVQLPAEQQHPVTGKLWFYCPSASARDRKIQLQTDENGLQKIPRQLFPEGNYTVKISWDDGKENFYAEEFLSIR